MQELNQPAPRQQARSISENSVVTRSIIIAAVLLAGIFTVLFFLEDNLAKIFGKYADEAVIGLMLLALWLVVSSTVRSVNSLAKGVAGWKLLLAGVLTAGVSGILYNAFLLLFPRISKSDNGFEVASASGVLILLLAALGFLISIVALVNIRVRNRMLAHVLEFVIIAGSIFGFVYLISK